MEISAAAAEEVNEKFKNPLHVAVIKGSVEEISALSSFRGSIDEEENGQTPLHLAVLKGKKLVLRELISLGADLSKRDKHGFAPLHVAVLHGRVSFIEDLVSLDADSNVDIFDESCNTALHIAVKIGNVKAVRALLAEGADADLPNRKGNTALHLAILQGNPGVIDVVCKFVRKPNIFDKNKFRPLHLAVLYNRIGAIRRIGKIKGFKINDRTGDGDNALHLAIKLRNLEAVAALLDLKANVNLRNAKGFTPMHLAVDYRNKNEADILSLICEGKRLVNAPRYVGMAQKGIPALRLLCRSKANVNTHDANGNSVLHSVAMTDCKDELKMLLDLGAKINARNSSGMTPLHVAVCFGNKDIIEMLINYGACITIEDNMGDRPIHTSARFRSSVAIEIMIKHKHNPDEENGRFLTPLDITMLSVREDIFATAVQAITDLYKEKRLSRKSPLSSHEILKSAKLIFKFEILKNFESSKLNQPHYLNNVTPILKNYANDCFAEIRIMNSTLLQENFTLYEFVSDGWDSQNSLTRASTSEVVLSHILEVSNTRRYPIYRDVIVSNMERSVLLKKVRCSRFPVICNERTTFLDLDAIYKYLGKDDILNLLLAYSEMDTDPGVSESSNVKKRNIAECEHSICRNAMSKKSNYLHYEI